jgi:hypothetical protein
MRRTILLALLAALVFAPSASAADWVKIMRDCVDDGVLQGNYTLSELRKAQQNIPTDGDEYSDCRDVLSRALAAKASTHKSDDSTTQSSSRPDPGVSSGSGGATHSTPAPAPAPEPTADPRATVVPTTPDDNDAVVTAREHGAPVKLGTGGTRPQPVKLSASIGRNGVPSTLIAVLALLAAATLAVAVPGARRLVHARRRQ